MQNLICSKFSSETIDDFGMLRSIDFDYPENFNFGFDVVDVLAETKPNKKAMIWLSKEMNERIFTFSDISKYSNMTANYFQSLGIKKGDKVMLLLKRHYQFWFCMIALHKIGAVVVPATHLLMKKDLVYRFNSANISAVICTSDDTTADEVDLAMSECPGLVTKIIVNKPRTGWHNFDAGITLMSEEFERGEDSPKAHDPMLMYFSSGTTGLPKMVVHDFTYPLGHIVTAKWWHNVKDDGLHLAISDTGWGKAVWGKLYGQWLCETCVFAYDFDRFHPDEILPLFAKYNITTFCAPPTMYRILIKEDLTKFDLSSLKYCTIAGEALNPEVFKQFYQATGIKLMEGFGQTETTLSVANLKGMQPKPGSMGKPNPQYKVVLLTPEGEIAKAGVNAEICIDTREVTPLGLFQGYYKDTEKTESAWNNGFYHTGDMAWMDEDGYYWYVGRGDDLIKSSGYRIGPFEIESVIMELPEVMEVAVTGVPDSIRGQVVKATIVLAKNAVASEELKKHIQEYVKEHTAPYKYPRVVEFVETLPKTVSGKIIRKDIK